jgi:hypothetical protein
MVMVDGKLLANFASGDSISHSASFGVVKCAGKSQSVIFRSFRYEKQKNRD